MNDIPPIQDPKNNYCLSYEGKEKADVLQFFQIFYLHKIIMKLVYNLRVRICRRFWIKESHEQFFTFADVSKAFDRVWIGGLLLKLERYGIKGDLLMWLKSYLTNRSQK
jgi:hypothetical protein